METINCDYCGNGDTVEIARGPDRYHGGPEVFTVVRCRACGLAYTNPRPDAAEMGRFYPEDYGPYAGGGSPVIRRLKSLLLAGQLRLLRGLLPPGGRILEVGCAGGEDLAGLRDRGGWKVQGVEMSPGPASRARERYGLDVWTGNLDDAPLPDKAFDLIKMKYVLEHLPAPGRAFARVGSLLKPGGIFLIWVPNIASPFLSWFGSRWQGLDLPRHLFHFQPRTLGKYCARHGFEIVRIGYSPVPNGIINSIRFVLEEKTGRPHAWCDWTNPFLAALCLPLGIALALLRLSDRTLYVLRKSSGRPEKPGG